MTEQSGDLPRDTMQDGNTGEELTLTSDKIRELRTGELALTESTWELAEEIADEIDMHPVTSGTAPRVNAAAALYLASVIQNEQRAFNVIGRAAGCSGAAISRRYPDIAEVIDGTDITDHELKSLYREAEETDRRERLKRHVWSATAFLIALVPGVFLAGGLGRALARAGKDVDPLAGAVFAVLILIPVVLTYVHVVYPWGVERFGVAPREKFRDNDQGGG